MTFYVSKELIYGKMQIKVVEQKEIRYTSNLQMELFYIYIFDSMEKALIFKFFQMKHLAMVLRTFMTNNPVTN